MLKHIRWFVAGTALVAALATSLGGQTPASTSVADQFERLHFRSIGPATMSGRITDFAVYEANPAIFYVGSAHGGVWKTTNNGATFTPQFQDQGLMSIGDVAVSQKNPDLVWVGTGEGNNRQSISWGDGVYKSTDGGKTFKHDGPRATRTHINRIVIDPRRQQHRARRGAGSALRPRRRSRRLQDDRRRRDLEAGAQGRRRHGRQRPRDGRDRSQDAVRVDVSAPALAVLHERRRSGQRHLEVDRRRRHVDESSRAGCRPDRSAASRLDVYRASANIVYASIEAEGGRLAARRWRRRRCAAEAARRRRGGRRRQRRLYRIGRRRRDRGARSSANNPRPMYFSQMRVDPNNPDRVLHRRRAACTMSTDGGKTLIRRGDPADARRQARDLVDPTNSESHPDRQRRRRRTCRCDMTQDVDRSCRTCRSASSTTSGTTWSTRTTSAAACRTTTTGADRAPSRIARRHHERRLAHGAGRRRLRRRSSTSATRASSTPNRRTATCTRQNQVTGESKSIRPTRSNVTPTPAAGEPPTASTGTRRCMFSPNDPGTLLRRRRNKVFKSTDRGDSWTAISPDLTTNANRDDVVTMGVQGQRHPHLAQRRHRGVADDRRARRIAEACRASTTPAPTTAS